MAESLNDLKTRKDIASALKQELQEQKQVYNLDSAYEDFVLRMNLIDSDYLNLDVPTAFTKNTSNFRDPYHLSKGEKAFLNAILFRKEN